MTEEGREKKTEHPALDDSVHETQDRELDDADLDKVSGGFASLPPAKKTSIAHDM